MRQTAVGGAAASQAQAAHARDFILANTALEAVPFLPEIRLQLATSVTPLWQATERDLVAYGIEPPFWAFAWAGGLGLARAVLDSPSWVRGRRVLDFASGSGVVAIAAALAGAAEVIAVDLDPFAVAAVALNAAQNGVRVEARCDDLLEATVCAPWAAGCDVVLAGDVCYDRAMTPRVMAFLRSRAAAGASVFLGDPGRDYLPTEGLEQMLSYRVPTNGDVESELKKTVAVHRVLGVPRVPGAPGVTAALED